MKISDLISDREKDLAPLFSPDRVSLMVTTLWIISIILAISWPYLPFYDYIKNFRIPQTFLTTFIAGLIMMTYIHLRCALGEIIPKGGFAREEREGLSTYEEEKGYLSYGFPLSLIQIVVFHLLILPLLVIGAATSGVSLIAFIQGLAILFTASLACWEVSFFFLLIWGRWRWYTYLGSRLFYFLFIFATALIRPDLNPILLLYNLHYGDRIPFGPFLPSAIPFLKVAGSIILLFFLVNFWIIRHNIRRRKNL